MELKRTKKKKKEEDLTWFVSRENQGTAGYRIAIQMGKFSLSFSNFEIVLMPIFFVKV